MIEEDPDNGAVEAPAAPPTPSRWRAGPASEPYRTLFRRSPVAMVRESRDGQILEANQALAELLGRRDPAGFIGMEASELFADAGNAERVHIRFTAEGRAPPRDVRLQRRDGTGVWVQETASLLTAPGVPGTQLIRSFVDIDQRRRREGELEELAYRDPLTGVANRRLLELRADQTLALAARRGVGAALVYLDLVDFKSVNDVHGHAVGDEVLAHVARCLENRARGADTVARIGGDEFAVLLSEVEGPDAARQAARRILDGITPRRDTRGTSIHVEGRAGVSVFPDSGRDLDILLRVADAALIMAKTSAAAVVVAPAS